ncbi:MAG: homocysteine S-methyltransferase family protein [Candidatus Omnitrophica bacterium]|nr:homocysteine S-methyltransferase family protein [Candidatus Omnitrophota bacterium]
MEIKKNKNWPLASGNWLLRSKKPIILDGAMGTQLQLKGLPTGVCPEKWCLDNPSKLSEVHSSYIKAGSDIIYTCTFGANIAKLSEYKLEKEVFNINKKLAQIARKNTSKKVLVAGDIGPTGKFVYPYGDMSFEETVDIFKQQVKGLLAGGVDLFVIETMIDLQEARAALLAVKETTDKPVMVTMTFDKDGLTLNGNDPVSCLIALQSLGANAFGCNCSVGPKEMADIIKKLKPFSTIPLIAKANAGLPRLENNKTVFDMSPRMFSKHAVNLVKAGVNLIGGCCGTTPEHINALSEKINTLKTEQPNKKPLSAICSPLETFILRSKTLKFLPIGEKINPTGKRSFQQALLCSDTSVIRDAAVEQHNIIPHAMALDVNVGAPNVNEKDMFEKAIKILVPVFAHPLVIDSSDVKALEHALRIYPGRTIINSISAEKEKLGRMLPIAAKYGAMFIALPLDGKKLPKTFLERKKAVEKIIKEASKFNIPKENIIVDALTLSISSNPEAVNEILKTIEWVSKKLNINTVIGLSNISFGLPRRDIVNTAFLKLAIDHGLSSAILDPKDFIEYLNVKPCKQAIDLLKGKDKDAKKYVAYATGLDLRPETRDQRPENQKPEKIVYIAILEGDRDKIKSAIEKALASNIEPETLLNNFMIEAINEAGNKFERKELFLPQLLASAETMKKGFEIIQPLLNKKTKQSQTKIILATVEGDIHDIGKNIVGLMLKNQGFTVIDLGNDVSAETIVEQAKKHKPLAIGLSALMTTTMINMKKVISLAKKENITCPILLGGAVVTEDFSKNIGGIYASNGVSTVNIIKKMT